MTGRARVNRVRTLWTTGPYCCRPGCEPAGEPVRFYLDDPQYPVRRCWGCGAEFVCIPKEAAR